MFRDVKVLVVEDDYDVRQLIRNILSAMTFAVETCDTLTEGIDRCKEAEILVLDLKLRGEDGRMLLRRWVEQHKGPVVVVSGFVEQDDEEELLASSAWNVLTKPFSHEAFRAILQRYGSYVLGQQSYQALKLRVEDLEIQIHKARRLAWTLAIVAAAAGAGTQPVLSLIGKLF